MRQLKLMALIPLLTMLGGCGSNELDVANKWNYQERMAGQARPEAAAHRDTEPCETTLFSSNCGAAPHGQKAKDIKVNE